MAQAEQAGALPPARLISQGLEEEPRSFELQQPWFSYLGTGRLTRFAFVGQVPEVCMSDAPPFFTHRDTEPTAWSSFFGGPAQVGDTLLFRHTHEASGETLAVSVGVRDVAVEPSLRAWLHGLADARLLGTALPGIDSVDLATAIYQGFDGGHPTSPVSTSPLAAGGSGPLAAALASVPVVAVTLAFDLDLPKNPAGRPGATAHGSMYALRSRWTFRLGSPSPRHFWWGMAATCGRRGRAARRACWKAWRGCAASAWMPRVFCSWMAPRVRWLRYRRRCSRCSATAARALCGRRRCPYPCRPKLRSPPSPAGPPTWRYA